jgi:hypothetical protein
MCRIIFGSKKAPEKAPIPPRDKQPPLRALDQAPDPTGRHNNIKAPAVIFVLLNLRNGEASPCDAIAKARQYVSAAWRNNLPVLFLLVVRKGAGECGVGAQHGSHAERDAERRAVNDALNGTERQSARPLQQKLAVSVMPLIIV